MGYQHKPFKWTYERYLYRANHYILHQRSITLFKVSGWLLNLYQPMKAFHLLIISFLGIIFIAFLLLIAPGLNRYFEISFPIEITHEGKVFSLPLSLDSLNNRLAFDSIFSCSRFLTKGYIAEKYTIQGNTTTAAFYRESRYPPNFIGLSFYYPHDSLQNNALKSRLQKHWNRNFKYQKKNESNSYWFMPISKHLTILIFNSKVVRQFIKNNEKMNFYRFKYSYESPERFVVAYVCPPFSRDENWHHSFYYHYSERDSFEWDDWSIAVVQVVSNLHGLCHAFSFLAW